MDTKAITALNGKSAGIRKSKSPKFHSRITRKPCANIWPKRALAPERERTWFWSWELPASSETRFVSGSAGWENPCELFHRDSGQLVYGSVAQPCARLRLQKRPGPHLRGRSESNQLGLLSRCGGDLRHRASASRRHAKSDRVWRAGGAWPQRSRVPVRGDRGRAFPCGAYSRRDAPRKRSMNSSTRS